MNRAGKLLLTITGILLFLPAGKVISQGLINNGAIVRIEGGTTMVISDATNGDLTNTDGVISNYGDLLIESDLVNNDSVINGSSATAEGRIKIDGTVSGTGQSYAERYYASQSNDGSKPTGRWWYVTPGVVGATSDNLLDATLPRIWQYDEATGGWLQITTDVSLTDLKGYATRVGSDESVLYNGTAFFDGTVNYSLTNSGNGWNLIGNPYPTTIDLDAALERNTALINDAAWIRTNLQYATWNSASDISTNGGSQYMSKMQAFWVLCESSGSFSFEDTDKNTEAGTLLKSASAAEKPTLRLEVSNNDTGDEAILAVREGAADHFEQFDTQKKFGSASAEVFFQLETGEQLTANVIPYVPEAGSYPLGIRTKATGEYVFRIKEFLDYPESTEVYLEDRRTGAIHLVEENLTYAFHVEEGTVSDRFLISFQNSSTVGTDPFNLAMETPRIYAHLSTLYIHSGNFGTDPLTLRVFDLNGREVYQQEFNGATRYSDEFSEMPGIYITRLSCGQKHFSGKIVIVK